MAPRSRRRIEWGSLIALPMGVGLMATGYALEGHRLGVLLQASAALVVFGGTLGAVLVSHPPRQAWLALRAARQAFSRRDVDLSVLGTDVVGMAMRVHRQGTRALESEVETVQDAFLRNGLMLVSDGSTGETVTRALRVEKLACDANEDAAARVWESAARYAPTLGALGTLMALVPAIDAGQEWHTLGHAAATGLVAASYGLGSAYLLFLPVAGRIREHSATAARGRELVTEALHAIGERTHPRLVAERIRPLAGNLPSFEDIETLARVVRH